MNTNLVGKQRRLRRACTFVQSHQNLSETQSMKEKEACADPENFVRGGPTLTTVFFRFF